MSRILSSLRYPLIQAPMAFAHDTELPLAVGKTLWVRWRERCTTRRVWKKRWHG